MTMIAVVDDDDDLRELMATRLRVAGYEVIEASDGETGLKILRDRRPDLVVLDWMMPGRSGIEVCRDVRGDPVLEKIPVLMTTARVTASDRNECLAAGVDSVLPKPFSLRSFLAIVQALLDQRDSLAGA